MHLLLSYTYMYVHVTQFLSDTKYLLNAEYSTTCNYACTCYNAHVAIHVLLVGTYFIFKRRREMLAHCFHNLFRLRLSSVRVNTSLSECYYLLAKITLVVRNLLWLCNHIRNQ